MRRGQIWQLDTGQPVVIVSSDPIIETTPLMLLCVGITDKTLPPSALAVGLLLKEDRIRGNILCTDIFTVPFQRLNEQVGTVGEKRMASLDNGLRAALGL